MRDLPASAVATGGFNTVLITGGGTYGFHRVAALGHNAATVTVARSRPCASLSASMTATMSRTSSQTPSMTATSSQTPTATPTATATPCFSANFRPLPRMDLVGDLLSSRSLVAPPGQGPASRPPAQLACEEACCQQPGCVGYSVSGSRPNDGFDNCFLFANVSELMPNNAFASGLLRAAL